MKSTPETRRRRMDQALGAVHRMWARYYRTSVEFTAAFEAMTEDERRRWSKDHGFSIHPAGDIRALFHDLGA